MSTPQTPPGTTASPIEAQAVVVGAGPVALFQVFQLGLLDIRAHVIDALPQPGGQPLALYPDKPIYDLPAVPVCTGRELTERLLEQVRPFAPQLHLQQTVDRLEPLPDGRWALHTSRGQCLHTPVVVIAAGVGAFTPRRLTLPGLETFEDRQVFHHPPVAGLLARQRVLVVGGEEDALDTALALIHTPEPDRPASVTLVHRRQVLAAPRPLLDAFEQAVEQGQLQWLVGQPVGVRELHGTLQGLEIATPEGHGLELQADAVLVRQGLSPRLGPMAHWGLTMERKQLAVDIATFETNLPGVYAVGDINTYPGKKKLLVCGFHECVLAAYAAAERVFPGQKPLLQYTTTSPKLHRLLGLGSPTTI